MIEAITAEAAIPNMVAFSQNSALFQRSGSKTSAAVIGKAMTEHNSKDLIRLRRNVSDAAGLSTGAMEEFGATELAPAANVNPQLHPVVPGGLIIPHRGQSIIELQTTTWTPPTIRRRQSIAREFAPGAMTAAWRRHD
jgi:hypothetical protein